MTASHGHVRGQVVRLEVHGSSPVVGSDPRSEPIWMTRYMPHQIKLTYGRRLLRLHQHPASGGWGSGGRDHSFNRLVRPAVTSVRPPGSGRTDQVRADGIRLAGTGFITAPSMTTPAVVYRHRAMRSLRARATMIFLRIPPPRRSTRSWNHRLSAEVGWFCNHSQASSTMVVRSRGLPDLETPCS